MTKVMSMQKYKVGVIVREAQINFPPFGFSEQ